MTARKPLEQKLRLGTARKDRMGPRTPVTVTVLPPATLGDAPGHLGAAGLALWQRALVEAPWIGRSDLPLLTQLAELEDEREQLRELLARDGRVLVAQSGYAYPHPAQSMLRATGAERLKLLAMAGMSPSDRSRIGVATVKARTKLDEIRERRRANDG